VHLSQLQKNHPNGKPLYLVLTLVLGTCSKCSAVWLRMEKRLKIFCIFHGSESCMISNQEIDNGLLYFPLDNIMEGFVLDSGRIGLKVSRWRLFQIFSLEHLDWGQDYRSAYLVMMEVHMGETIYEQ
jgi:hypothetical protein